MQLESHGIKFGAHQNAYTSFEETVYELHVPADQPVLLERSLRVLRQLALEVRAGGHAKEGKGGGYGSSGHKLVHVEEESLRVLPPPAGAQSGSKGNGGRLSRWGVSREEAEYLEATRVGACPRGRRLAAIRSSRACGETLGGKENRVRWRHGFAVGVAGATRGRVVWPGVVDELL